MPAVASITYAGSLLSADAVSSSPWTAWGIQFPGRGGPVTVPQFMLEVLEPDNVDGARFRTGGAHFPPFECMAVIPAATYTDATVMARDLERTKGDRITISWTTTGIAGTFYVKEVKAVANSARIIGATSQGAGNAPDTASTASVDVAFVLQFFTA